MPSNPHRIIHTALAAPGAGKTEKLIQQLPLLMDEGKRVVLAAPTILLANDIARRSSGIAYRVIHSSTHQPVGPELESALRNRTDRLLITTHESLFQVKPHLLNDWTLIVDEIPQVLALPYYWFDPIELAGVLAVAVEVDGRLYLRDEQRSAVELSLETYKADAAGGERTSLLSAAGAMIYQSLLLERTVFIDTSSDNGKRCIRPIVEIDCWSRIAAAEEMHVLGANISGSLFDCIAQVHGFKFLRSPLTPKWTGYQCPITIYPLFPQGRNYSKSAALTTLEGERTQKHAGTSQGQVIDALLEAALAEAGGRPLLFVNQWANFHWMKKDQAILCAVDSRGLNDYADATDAILLFGGNPSPAEQLGLEHLAEKYGCLFTDAFVVTRLLEASLQAATRTAVRVYGNSKSIRVFVQDERVAEYLRSTYMPDAVIDWSLALKAPVAKDGRKTVDPRKEQAFELFTQEKANAEVVAIIGVHRNTASNWRKEWQLLQAA